MNDVNDGGVVGKNHGGPGWDSDPGFFPQNRRNTHRNAEDGLREADERIDAGDEYGYGGREG